MPASSSSSVVGPAPRTGSPLARGALAAVVVLIVYASLVPWAGWIDRGLSPFAWLDAPVPRYITGFDVIVNALAYLPLGALVVLALYPRLRGAGAVLVAVLAGGALSATMETLQTYLPPRIPSNLDFFCNALGTLLGAALAAPAATSIVERGKLIELRARWFEAEAPALLLVLATWPLVQLHPLPMLFGAAPLAGVGDALRAALGPQRLPVFFAPEQFVLAEVFVIFTAMLAVGLGFAAIQRPGAPRRALVAALFVAALVARAIAFGNRFGPERALAWITPGAIAGVLLGALALAIALAAPRRALLHGALLCALLWFVAIQVVPLNPYYGVLPVPRRLDYVQELLRWFALAWPWALVALLAAASARSWRRPRTL